MTVSGRVVFLERGGVFASPFRPPTVRTQAAGRVCVLTFTAGKTKSNYYYVVISKLRAQAASSQSQLVVFHTVYCWLSCKWTPLQRGERRNFAARERLIVSPVQYEPCGRTPVGLPSVTRREVQVGNPWNRVEISLQTPFREKFRG